VSDAPPDDGAIAKIATAKTFFALAQIHAARHKERAFQASSPKTRKGRHFIEAALFFGNYGFLDPII
jgi:hypothetical protein